MQIPLFPTEPACPAVQKRLSPHSPPSKVQGLPMPSADIGCWPHWPALGSFGTPPPSGPRLPEKQPSSTLAPGCDPTAKPIAKHISLVVLSPKVIVSLRSLS